MAAIARTGSSTSPKLAAAAAATRVPTSFAARLKAVVDASIEDDLLGMAAQLAFYAVLSMSPLLLLGIWIGTLISNDAESTALAELRQLLGPQVAEAAALVIDQPPQPPTTDWLAASATFALLLFGASAVFASLQASLNRIWQTDAAPLATGWWAWIRRRLLSMGLVLSLGFVVIVSLVVGSAVAQVVGEEGVGWVVANQLVAFAVYALFFALVFKVLPDRHLSWRDVALGAAITAALFVVGKFGIELYLALNESQVTRYGPAAALVVLLLWVNYAGVALYFGAEAAKVWVIERERGG